MILLEHVLNYLEYFAIAILLLIVSLAIYVKVLPANELRQIRERNDEGAAFALGGVAIGYALVLYVVTAHGASIVELIVWALISLAIQIIISEIIFFFFKDFRESMQKGEVAHGIMLGAFSIAVGIVNAGCLTP